MNYTIIYCTQMNQQIVILHSFVKKTQKIPLKELRIAKTRMNEVKNEH
jgi:phage-related protein